MTRIRPSALFVTAMLLFAASVAAQTSGDQEPQEPQHTSSIKKISLSFGGGYYSGDTYYALPPMSERAQVADHSFDITLFNGDILPMGTGIHDNPNGLSAPRKEIDAGNVFFGDVGFYLSEEFHINLRASIAQSDAILSMERIEDGQPTGERIYGTEAEGWVDTGFKSYMAGMDITYDTHHLAFFGLTPYFGFGIGGVINSFTALEDKTGLYFNLFGGLLRPLGKGFNLDARLAALTYPFETEEVNYSQQVTMMAATIGLTKIFDVKPFR